MTLGYDSEDVRSIESDASIKTEAGWRDLTDHSTHFLSNVYYPVIPYNAFEVWNRIRPTLEPIVQQAKAMRLARERAAVIDSRNGIVESL